MIYNVCNCKFLNTPVKYALGFKSDFFLLDLNFFIPLIC